MTHLNITLPDNVAERLAVIPDKSGFIAKILKEKFEQERQNEVERLMIEGYKATKLEDRELNAEWERATLEKWD